MANPAHRSPALFESVFEAATEGVVVYRLVRDHRGIPARFRRTLANARALQLLAQPEAAVLERALPELPTQDLFDEYAAVATSGQTFCFNKVVEDLGGEIVTAYQVEATPLDDGLMLKISDATVRLRESRAWAQQTERLSKLARRSRDLLVIAHPDGRIITALGAVEAVMGKPAATFTGTQLCDLVHRDERHLLMSGTTLRPSGTLRVRARPTDDNATRWLELRLEEDGPHRLVALRDITVLRSLEDRIAELEPQSSTKGVASRAQFMERFEQEMARRRRYGRLTTVAVVALDQQKALLATLGEPGLKRARLALAEASVGLLRTVDLVAQWSDDALIFLLPETPVKGGFRACERLAERLRDDVVEFEGKTLSLTLSAGVTGLDADDDVRSVLSRAGKAINRARKKGLGQVMVANAIDEG
ncbi:MAG: diguanylate cyclase [Myxococcota bacterium]